jgi:hypothetical protein
MACLAVAPLLAQEGSLPTPGQNRVGQETPVARAWSRFLQEQGANWQVEWTTATGTPAAIWGPGLRLAERRIDTIEDARGFASQTLDRFAELLGRGESTFVETIGQKVRAVHILVYDQYWRGLPVISGRADVRIHDVGVLSLFGARAVQIPAGFDPTPVVGREHAIAIAYHAAGVQPVEQGPLAIAPATRLVIWANTQLQVATPVRLAWEVRIDAPQQKKEGRSYVDAQTGQVLDYRNDLHECSAGCNHAATAPTALARELRERAKGFEVEVEHGAPVPGLVNVTGTVRAWVNLSLDNRRTPSLPTLTNVPLSGVRVSIPSTGAFALTDGSGNFNITHAGTVAVPIRVEFVSARHIADVFPAVGFGTKLLATPSATPGTPITVTLLTSTAAEFDQSQTTAYHLVDDVHDYVAGLIGANLPAASNAVRATVNVNSACNATYSSGSNLMSFYRQSGTAPTNCVNTAYTTVVQHEWGHGLDNWYGGISQTDGLSEGWGDILGTFHSGQPRLGPNFRYDGTDVRSALNTRTFPAGGGVHQQGETWMGWAWDVRTNLITKYGTTRGIQIASEIIIPSIVANALNQPNAVREVYLIDDTDGNLGNGTPHCIQLNLACTKRTLPIPAGLACSGNNTPMTVSPAAALTAEQSSNNTFPFGQTATHSYMQVHGDLNALAKAVTGINFRRDGVLATNPAYSAKTLTLQLYFGRGSYESFDTTFAANYTVPRTLVANGVFNMPGWPNLPPYSPAPFSFRIPTAAFGKVAGNDFVWEARVSAMSSAHVMYADAFSGTGDLASVNGVTYGVPGCIATGQVLPFQATMTATTSKKNNQHTLALGAIRAAASSSCAFWLSPAAASLPVGLCAPIQVNIGGWLYTASGTSNASGTFTLPTVNWPYHPAWIGFNWFGQSIGFDAGKLPIPLILSTPMRVAMPAPIGLQIARLYNTGSAAATTGTLGVDYGLVIGLD